VADNSKAPVADGAEGAEVTALEQRIAELEAENARLAGGTADTPVAPVA
jgi:uncharacterized small protein (DUF1192 family)